MGFLRRSQEWAADRGWAQYPEPEWKQVRLQENRPSRLDVAFKWTVAGLLLWPIIAPVLLGILVGFVILLGYMVGN